MSSILGIGDRVRNGACEGGGERGGEEMERGTPHTRGYEAGDSRCGEGRVESRKERKTPPAGYGGAKYPGI